MEASHTAALCENRDENDGIPNLSDTDVSKYEEISLFTDRYPPIKSTYMNIHLS